MSWRAGDGFTSSGCRFWLISVLVTGSTRPKADDGVVNKSAPFFSRGRWLIPRHEQRSPLKKTVDTPLPTS